MIDNPEKNTEAYEEGKAAYDEDPWAGKIPNPYDKETETAEFEEFNNGYNEADFLARVEAGYYDWYYVGTGGGVGY